MKTQMQRPFLLMNACLALSLSCLAGCTHGSDDTGGNTSAGSMSGTTDPQITQSRANSAPESSAGGTSRRSDSTSTSGK